MHEFFLHKIAPDKSDQNCKMPKTQTKKNKLNHGEFIRKIYDTDLFFKNLCEKSTHPPKNANRLFFGSIKTTTTSENLISQRFFLKNVYYSFLFTI